jgi:hypothetical protein
MTGRREIDLIDRYVDETLGLLPRRTRAEAERDLRTRIQVRLEAGLESRQEAPESGESTEGGDGSVRAEVVEQVLRELGPPEVVAAELRPGRDWLIAPHLVRPFVTAVTIALSALVVLTGTELLTGPGGVTGEDGRLLDLLLRAVAELDDLVLKALLILTGLIALFVFLDRTVEGEAAVRERWSVRSLARKDPDRVRRGGAILEMALAGAALVILHGTSFELGSVVSVGDHSGWVPLRVPAMRAQLLWVDAWLVGTIALDGILLWRGRWGAMTHLAEAGLSCLMAWIVWRVRSAAQLLVADAGWMAEHGWPAEAVERYREALEGPLDEVLHMTLTVIVAICLFVAALEIFRAIRSAWRHARRDRRKSGPSAPVTS